MNSKHILLGTLILCLFSQVGLAKVSVSHHSEAELSDETNGKKRVHITLSDGQEMIGRVKCKDQQCSISSKNGLKMQIERSAISKIRPLSARELNPNSDANRTRYLYSPSAFSLRQGEGYLSQKELFFTSVAYGITDRFTILGGAVLPLWATDAFNIILGAKYAIELSEDWRIAAGAETFNFPDSSVGLIQSFFGVTYGSEDGHLTLNVGKPFAYATDTNDIWENPDVMMVSLSGNKKISHSARILTENWFIFPLSRPNANLRLHSLALRLQGESLAVDLGGVFFGYDNKILPFPLPWLDFAYNF